MNQQLQKHITHLAVRFYRAGGLELLLVPLLRETAHLTRSAGDGYHLVVLIGEPGTAYPLDLRTPASLDPDYLAAKFRLDRRGFGYTPEELATTLQLIANDIAQEEALDQ